MKKTSYRNKGSAQRGQAIVIIALSMIALLAFMVLAIDGGKYYDQRRTAQNASDAASLAGLYQYQHGGTANKQHDILIAINTAAEKNGIPDPDTTPNDAANANVTAYWINSLGQGVNMDASTSTDPTGCSTCKLTDSTTNGKPSGATGLKVRAIIPYVTFVGGFIGHSTLQAQADGTALIFPGSTTPPNPGGRDGVWTGSPNCSTATNPAFYWGGKSANNTDFGNGVTVNGWFRVDTEPNGWDKQGGSGDIVVLAGPNTAVDNSGTALTVSPYVWRGPTSAEALAVTSSWPDWAYIKKDKFAPNVPPSKMQIQASFFRPSQDKIATGDTVDTPLSLGISTTAQAVPATASGNWIFYGHELNIGGGGPPTQFYHYIKDTDAAKNGTDLVAMLAAGKTGIFFIDGDLDTSAQWADGSTVVATGKVHIIGNNNTYGTAGLYAFGMTVLAGGTSSTIPPSDIDMDCATPSKAGSNYVLHFDGNQSNWDGIMYVPNGLFWIDTNWKSSYNPLGPIIAYSQATALSGGNPANNLQFSNCDASCLPQPNYQMGLQQ